MSENALVPFDSSSDVVRIPLGKSRSFDVKEVNSQRFYKFFMRNEMRKTLEPYKKHFEIGYMCIWLEFPNDYRWLYRQYCDLDLILLPNNKPVIVPVSVYPSCPRCWDSSLEAKHRNLWSGCKNLELANEMKDFLD